MRAIKARIKDLMRSRFFIILLALAVFFTVVPAVLSAMGRQDLLRSAVNFVATPFRNAAVWCGESLKGFTDYFTEYDRLVAENEELREKLEAALDKNDKADAAIEENEWLKNFLLYAEGEVKYSLIDARAVGRESGDAVTGITLNKGSVHGIRRGMTVMNELGVIGYISEVGLSYSKVTTIVSDGSAAGVICLRSGAYGTVDGSYSYLSDGFCKMICPDPDADIAEGDLICTSGTGSVYPYGLAFGRVVSVEKDPYTRKTVAYIEPSVDLSRVGRVMVIAEDLSGGESDGQ